jgi:biotin carboxyl carrier protein
METEGALGSVAVSAVIYEVIVEGTAHRLQLERTDGGWKCVLDGAAMQLDAVLTRRDVLSILVDGRSYEVKREQTSRDLHMWVGSERFAVELRDPRSLRGRRAADEEEHGPKKLIASMPGRVVRILLEEKSQVEAGQGVVVVEAMKMQNEIKSPKKGLVQKILAITGANVNAGDVLAIVE